ncbi:ABC transporter ATP-binding protein [Paeniglutamicibacter psychrophenolicus]|uniref:ABC-2 type transport system ATP-binding protein n=1 Tax=Paeniglutamicibacter psychrophenolicus TaxID=257454 RepID=A0ABS4WAQ5_9MICC|nr:ABC transporter ATP-binding protein [Paeniglutamicibacter psychrophenolicus]MBP2373233.1 ABC-2 type transport system ATP-binding protein [Paeniglutamicibacter psychrophenolicus]
MKITSARQSVSTGAVPSSRTALELNAVHKSFRTNQGRIEAVAGIDLRVGTGEIVAFLGPNGAGKTTTIDMMLGLTTPTSGTVSVFGRDPRTAVEAGQVSAVLQTGGLLRDLSVRETVTAIAALHGAKDRIEEVMERTEISSLARRKVSKCSGGEQQRLKFALALLPDPQLLILDEPTAGMDVAARHAFWDTMRQDALAGRTVLFATHYLEEAQDFAERTVLIGSGRVLADGPTAKLREMTGGRVVSAMLPPGRPTAPALAALEAVGQVSSVRLNGLRVSVTGPDSDTAARMLLNELAATDLEITAPTLEAAFMALTGEDS